MVFWILLLIFKIRILFLFSKKIIDFIYTLILSTLLIHLEFYMKDQSISECGQLVFSTAFVIKIIFNGEFHHLKPDDKYGSYKLIMVNEEKI